jgi:putative ABC transport system permease protein
VLQHYLLTLYRALTRHRLYAVLNVLGLAVGVAVFLVLALVVRFETSFERWIPHASQIYAIRTNVKNLGWEPYTMGDLLEELRADYPQVIGTRLTTVPAVVRQGGNITADRATRVDPSFFKVFDLPLIAGDKAALLQAPDEVVITRAEARRYFGDANPIGQRLTLDFSDEVHDYRVVGELKDTPPTTDLKFDLMVPLRVPTPEQNPRWRHWGALDTSTYLRLASPADARALEGELDHFTDRHARPGMPRPLHTLIGLRLSPLLAMHLIVPPALAIVTALSVVGTLTLLLAAVNYVNLATARAALRAREVALRKVLGATGPGLIAQFMAESVATAALGTLVGVALCELSLPLLNAAIGVTLKLDYFGDPGLDGMILAVIAVVGCGAGIYPALVLSRFQPAAVLASARSPGGGRAAGRLREGLVILQFSIAIAFTISTAVIASQSQYVHKADLGFRRDGLIEVSSFPHPGLTQAQRSSLLTAWRALPGIVGATQSDSTPGDPDAPVSTYTRPGVPGDGQLVHDVTIGPDFFKTYGARLLAGRLPDQRHGADFPFAPPSPSQSQPWIAPNVVLNARALALLGFRNAQDAIGKMLVSGQRSFLIIGIVADLRFTSPRLAVEPTLYWPTGGAIDGGAAAVRYDAADPKAVLAQMGAVWRQVAPTEPFEAKPVAGELESYYRADDQVSRMLTLAAVLAVFIGCIGLYGLASFNTARRVREIGIRKTLGASTRDILQLLIGQFLRPVIVANLIAWPLAFLAMSNWLASFDQRVGLSPLYFLSATALTLLIALVTVGGQAWSVARAEPVQALRHE